MISIYIVIVILVIHWIGDFILQTDWQAKNKSKSWSALLSHTLTYSSFWLLPICVMAPKGTTIELIRFSLMFAGITWICHTATDYITSRINSKLWTQGKTHEFF